MKEQIRQLAMTWWNTQSSPQKTQLCDINTEYLGSARRWETLTGYEIERLWKDINVLPKFTTIDIVKKLIGPIKPIGETNADNISYSNLISLCEMIEDLLNDISEIGLMRSEEFSVKRSKEFAKSFITSIVH
jgi:hypothetical protein